MADPAVTLADLSRPRRVAIAEVLRQTLATERELAALYAAFAACSTLHPLRAALTELAAAKATHVATLEPLTRALDSTLRDESTSGARNARSLGADSPHTEFAQAFRGERATEVGYRELAALVGNPALLPGLPQLAAAAAQHRARLRELYLRYS